MRHADADRSGSAAGRVWGVVTSGRTQGALLLGLAASWVGFTHGADVSMGPLVRFLALAVAVQGILLLGTGVEAGLGRGVALGFVSRVSLPWFRSELTEAGASATSAGARPASGVHRWAALAGVVVGVALLVSIHEEPNSGELWLEPGVRAERFEAPLVAGRAQVGLGFRVEIAALLEGGGARLTVSDAAGSSGELALRPGDRFLVRERELTWGGRFPSRSASGVTVALSDGPGTPERMLDLSPGRAVEVSPGRTLELVRSLASVPGVGGPAWELVERRDGAEAARFTVFADAPTLVGEVGGGPSVRHVSAMPVEGVIVRVGPAGADVRSALAAIPLLLALGLLVSLRSRRLSVNGRDGDWAVWGFGVDRTRAAVEAWLIPSDRDAFRAQADAPEESSR